MYDDKVVCPFHGASFNLKDGSLENGPAIDPIPSFDVVEKKGEFYVKVPEHIPLKGKFKFAKRDQHNKTRYVIVGGGIGGMSCADTLRESGFTGEIVVISREDRETYDKTLITKMLPEADSHTFAMRTKHDIQDAHITWKGGKHVTSVNAKEKFVTLNDGSTL